MCFSASASFTASIVLTAIGVATLKKVQHPSQIMFASIPYIFAVMQIAEGILWLSIPNGELLYLQESVTYFYLIIAQIVWPVWIPISILLLDQKRAQKKMQILFIGIGILVAVYLTYCLFNFNVTSSIDGSHISYLQTYPESFRVAGGTLFIAATILPTFFSSNKWMWILGITVFISYIISTLLYENYLVSVWCFFASVISISVYLILKDFKLISFIKEKEIASNF